MDRWVSEQLPLDRRYIFSATVWIILSVACTIYVSQLLARWYKLETASHEELATQLDHPDSETKLFQQILWRGFTGGLIYGLIIGIGYALVSFAVYQIYMVGFYRFEHEGIPFYAIFVLSDIAAVVGIVVNPLAGLLNGLGFGIVTRANPSFLQNWSRHHRVGTTISACSGLFCGLIGYGLTSELLLKTFSGFSAKTTWLDIFFGIVIPVLLTIITTLLGTARIARWYKRESANGIAQNVSPN